MEFRSPVYLLFVDFEKAFDRLNRKALWNILEKHGVPPKLVNIMKDMYYNATSRVLHKGKISNPFPIESGVKQGCVLSPILFLLAIDPVMRTVNQTKQGIQWGLTEQLDDLDYADDLCLLSHTFQGIQRKLCELDKVAVTAGLQINFQKTKEMRIQTANKEPLRLNTEIIERCDQFCYLGSIVTENGGTEMDINSRILKARQAFGALYNFWRSSVISRRTKVRIFNTNA